MEKGMLEELLLVCTFVGTQRAASDAEGGEELESFVRGEDCMAWLQDLQRTLRRDETDESSVRVTIGSWKVLRTKLLPIAEASAGDVDVTRTLIKIFVLLTMPLRNRAIDALRVAPSAAMTTPVEKEFASAGLAPTSMERLRAAAGEQVRHIADARVAITAKPKVLRVLLAFFQAPLAKRASERNGNDSRDVELALTLLRNLVAPLPKVNDHIDAIVDSSWDELVAALDKELMFEIVAALAAAVRRRENETLNLMLVEIFAALFTQHAPADVVAAEFNDNAISSAIEHEVWQSEKRVAKGPLVEALRRERSSRVLETSTRHPRFGSLLRLPPAPGTEGDMGDCVSGVTALASRAALLTGGITSTRVVSARRRPIFIADNELDKHRRRGRKKRRVDDCRGDGEDPLFSNMQQQHDEANDSDREDIDLQARSATRPEEVLRVPHKSRLGVAARRSLPASLLRFSHPHAILSAGARKALADLAKRLSLDACGELFDSAKHELRLDSDRVLPRDKHCFFALTEFFLAWRRERGFELSRRLSAKAREASEKRDARLAYQLEFFGNDSSLETEEVDKDFEQARINFSEDVFFPKTLLRVLDVFSVKAVIEDIDFCLEHRRYREVERSTSVYKEMLRALEALRDGDGSERADRHKLVGSAMHAASSKQPTYAALVSEGMLDRIFYAAEPLDPLPKLLREWKATRNTKRHACVLAELVHVSCKLLDIDEGMPTAERSERAASLELPGYIAKLASATALELYAALLESYVDNSPAVNHFVFSFLYRLGHTPLDSGLWKRKRCCKITPTSAKIQTLEPLLYTVRFFAAFANILSNRTHDRNLVPLAQFARDTLRHFDAHASRNPLLYVEALFSHGGAFATKWCISLADTYRDVRGLAEGEDDVDREREPHLGGQGRGLECASHEDDSDAELDFDEAKKWDRDAKKRKSMSQEAKKKLGRWLPQEDAALALMLADEHDEGTRDCIDLDTIIDNLKILQPHHANASAVRRRIGRLEKQAVVPKRKAVTHRNKDGYESACAEVTIAQKLRLCAAALRKRAHRETIKQATKRKARHRKSKAMQIAVCNHNKESAHKRHKGRIGSSDHKIEDSELQLAVEDDDAEFKFDAVDIEGAKENYEVEFSSRGTYVADADQETSSGTSGEDEYDTQDDEDDEDDDDGDPPMTDVARMNVANPSLVAIATRDKDTSSSDDVGDSEDGTDFGSNMYDTNAENSKHECLVNQKQLERMTSAAHDGGTTTSLLDRHQFNGRQPVKRRRFIQDDDD